MTQINLSTDFYRDSAMQYRRELLTLLSDGRFHSGEALGHALGVSRAKVWLSLKSLAEYGISVEAVKGRGYRLSKPLELFAPQPIASCLTRATQERLNELEIFLSIDSTNAYLMQRGAHGAASGTVCIAEHQSAGKGRRGRGWVSPLGRNLYLSILWRFSESPMRLAGLSLAVAVAVVEALQQTGITGLSIKWPNDIFSAEGKVGGILLEVAGESSGPCYGVIGVGMNVDMPAAAMADVTQPWANLPRESALPSRNEMAAQLINHLFSVLREYPVSGLAPFLARWNHYDLASGKLVDLHLHDRIVTGVACGVDETGALQVDHEGQLKHYTSGEVSLRLAERS